jgi:hypothetical protein
MGFSVPVVVIVIRPAIFPQPVKAALITALERCL